MCRLNVGWVLERAPWQLGERPAVLVVALCLHLKAALLRHGSVPARVAASDLWRPVGYAYHSHAVGRDQGGEQRDVRWCRKPVFLGFMGGHVNDRINIGLSRLGISKKATRPW